MEVESEIVKAIHRARAEPQNLAKSIRARLAHFKGTDYFPESRGGKVAVASKEGRKAVEEALAFLAKHEVLNKSSPLPPISEPLAARDTESLKLACQGHRVDRGSLGAIGHAGADGSSAAERISRYGAWAGAAGECLWFGRAGATAETIVEDLIIDDGVADRGHRKCIFDGRYTVAAARLGEHATFGTMAVIEFAGTYDAAGFEDAVAARKRAGAAKPDKEKHGASGGQTTQWANSIGTCAGCGERIQGGSVMEVDGLGKFHKGCFKCAECGTALVGVPWRPSPSGAADGNGGKRVPLCEACHIEKFAAECVGCNKKISGAYVKINGQPYHKECKGLAAAAAAPAADGGGPGMPKAASKGGVKPGAKPGAAKKGAKLVSKPATIAGARMGMGSLMDDYANL